MRRNCEDINFSNTRMIVPVQMLWPWELGWDRFVPRRLKLRKLSIVQPGSIQENYVGLIVIFRDFWDDWNNRLGFPDFWQFKFKKESPVASLPRLTSSLRSGASYSLPHGISYSRLRWLFRLGYLLNCNSVIFYWTHLVLIISSFVSTSMLHDYLADFEKQIKCLTSSPRSATKNCNIIPFTGPRSRY